MNRFRRTQHRLAQMQSTLRAEAGERLLSPIAIAGVCQASVETGAVPENDLQRLCLEYHDALHRAMQSTVPHAPGEDGNAEYRMAQQALAEAAERFNAERRRYGMPPVGLCLP